VDPHGRVLACHWNPLDLARVYQAIDLEIFRGFQADEYSINILQIICYMVAAFNYAA